jgi:RNA polymerase sigma-70 factor, ECF subfamily
MSADAIRIPGTAFVSQRTEADVRFERALAEWGASLSRIAVACSRDHADAEDLLQDIHFAVWKGFAKFRGECSERTFVFRIAHNRALSHIRRRVRTVVLDDECGLADPRPGPADHALSRLANERLMAAVRSLPELLRQAVMLQLEGLSNPEIADVLGVTAGNVAVRLTRGRKRLRELIEKAGHDE